MRNKPKKYKFSFAVSGRDAKRLNSKLIKEKSLNGISNKDWIFDACIKKLNSEKDD